MAMALFEDCGDFIYQIAGRMDEILFLYDVAAKRFCYVSPAYEKLWGKTCRSLHDDPRSFFKSVHPEDRQHVETELERHWFETYEKVFRIIRTDGSIRWIHARIFPISDTAGRVFQITGIARDVSKLVFAERMLRLKEQRYRVLFNGVHDAVFVSHLTKWDLSDAFIEFNENAIRLTGYSRNELMRQSPASLMTPPERCKIPAISENIFNRQNYLFETKLLTKSGAVIPVEINANLFQFVDQPAILSVVRDISPRKDLARQIQKYRKSRHFSGRLMKSVEDERKKIALELHDEIGQRVASLRLEMESCFSCLSDDRAEMRGRLKKMIHHTEKLAERIRNVTSDLRPDMLDTMGLVYALQWLVDEFSRRFPHIAADFKTRGLQNRRIDPDVEIVIFRIIQESLANIARHAEAGSVEIGLTCSFPGIILTITDSGKGFDPHQASCEAFLHKHGIGLMGMRERAASVGGTAVIRSRIGGGTVIRAVLPAAKGNTV